MIIDVADEAEPDRPDDDAAGRRRTRSSRCPARAPTSSTARSSASTAASSSRARRPTHDRSGHRRRLGQRRPGGRRSSGCPAPGETVIGGRVRAAPRRQGRQPGRRGGPARRADVRSSARSATTRSAATRARRSRPRGSMSSALFTLPGEPTGVALILVDDGGENSDRGRRRGEPGARLRAGPGGAQAPRRSTRGDVVLVGHEIRTGATHEALRARAARRRDHDPQSGPGAGLERPTLELADILTPNEGELAALAGGRGRAVGPGQAPARCRAG